MPYSFDLTAKNKAEAIAECAKRIEAVAKEQSEHKADKPFALATVEKFLGLMQDVSETDELAITVNGSIKVTDDGISYVSFHVSGYVQPIGVEI